MPEHDTKVRKRIYRAELGAYLLIVTIGIIGFWQNEKTQDRLCDNVQANREVTAELVTSIYRLGVGLVTDGDKTLTPEQVDSIHQFEAFRDERLATLEEEPCED